MTRQLSLINHHHRYTHLKPLRSLFVRNMASTPAIEPATVERKEDLRYCLSEIRSRVASSSQATPKLVAVSKYKPASDILACYQDSEHIDFGENYVQELVDKAALVC